MSERSCNYLAGLSHGVGGAMVCGWFLNNWRTLFHNSQGSAGLMLPLGGLLVLGGSFLARKGRPSGPGAGAPGVGGT